ACHARDRIAGPRRTGDEAGEGSEVGGAEAPPAPDPPSARRPVAPAEPEDSHSEPVPGGRLDAARFLQQPRRGGAQREGVRPRGAAGVGAVTYAGVIGDWINRLRRIQLRSTPSAPAIRLQ